MALAIKFRDKLPWSMELKLMHRFGYIVEGRDWHNKTVTYTKRPDWKPGLNAKRNFDEFTQAEKTALEKRCDAIVDYFPDPYAAVMAVRQRLHNMAQGLSPERREYVLNYMEENFPESWA